MLVSIEEAKGKWCPFARVARHETIIENRLGEQDRSTIIGGVNRDALGKATSPIASCRCLANDCMAWRWFEFEEDENGRRVSGTRGMCGLAGRQW